MKKYILGLVLFSYSIAANATNYYVSNTGSDANNGTSTATPWQTLSRVKTAGNNGTILAGDNIYFKKGDNFIGGMYWSTLFGNTAVSGTAGNPITFSSYGTGAKPIFQVTPNANLGVSMLSFVGVNYITIDGFNITDLSFPIGDKVNKAYCGNGLELGSYGQITSNNCIVKNCTFSNIGAPVVIIGNFNTVDSCSMTDLKNIKNTLGTAGQPATFDDDYGANGITITGNDNTVTHSYFSGNWASSYDYGYNGGAFEMFDGCSRNKFLYNTITDCGGVAEFGAIAANTVSTDNLYAYNKIINCGLINWCNLTGSYTTNVNNTQYFNNVIIENTLSRFSGPNNGAGVTTNPPATLQSFSYNGTPSTTVYNLKNNIFQLSSGINVLSTYAVPKTTHANNIYKLSNGGVTNFTPGASELQTSAVLFANTTASDATVWDFNMIAGSPGIAFGQSVSLTPDFAGVAVATPPNAGVYDTRPATSSVRTRLLMTFQPVTGRAGFPVLDTVREVISSLMYDSLKHLYVDTSIRRNGYLLAFDSVNHKWYLSPGTASTGVPSQWITNGTAIHYPTGRVGVNTTTPISRFNVQDTNLVVTQNDTTGIMLSNTAPATAAIPLRIPPALVYKYTTWDGAVSRDTRWRTQPGTNPLYPNFVMQRSMNGGASYSDALTLNEDVRGYSINLGGSAYGYSANLDGALNSGSVSTNSIVVGSTTSNVPYSNSFFKNSTLIQENTSVSVVNSFGAEPNISISSPTAGNIVRGFYYNPTLSNLTNTSHYGFWNTSGNNLLGTISGSTGIGATTTIAASAILQVTSTTQGVLIPQMTTTQRDAIATPATGLNVYNTTSNSNNTYDGVSWKQQSFLGYTATTVAYTALTTDYTINCTTGTFTVTLPTAVGISGKIYIVKNSGTGVITVATTSSQTLDGATTKVYNTQYSGGSFQSNGANWIITGNF